MGQPPDRTGLVAMQPQIRMDNNKKLSLSTPGGKYLVMSRINTDDSNANLNNVSPFLIKKVIDNTCCGEVELCKKLRNGTVLIKTKTITQAEKLIKLCSLSATIDVQMSEHNTLNFCKGVIYSNDLRGIPNEVILEELKNQNVIKVDKILKRENDELKETGLIIITLSSLSLPSELAIGYEKVKMRPYIPLPMRCNNCFVYGHIAKHCKNDKLCGNCGELFHTNVESKEQCNNAKICCNCKKEGCIQFHHSAFDKICPTFLKEKQIQTIITLEKMNRRAAIATYNSRNPAFDKSFSSIIRSNNMHNDSPLSRTTNTVIMNPTVSMPPPPPPRTTVDYSDVLHFVDLKDFNEKNKTTQPSKTVILPLKTSARTRNQMKQLAKKQKKETGGQLSESDNPEDNTMDFDGHI